MKLTGAKIVIESLKAEGMPYVFAFRAGRFCPRSTRCMILVLNLFWSVTSKARDIWRMVMDARRENQLFVW